MLETSRSTDDSHTDPNLSDDMKRIASMICNFVPYLTILQLLHMPSERFENNNAA